MILTPAEKWELLDGVIELLQQPDFALSHCDVARPQREVPSDQPGFRKWADPGVRVITIIGTVPVDEDSYGPTESENVDAEDLELVLE